MSSEMPSPHSFSQFCLKVRARNRQMLIATAETTTATTCVGDFGSSRKVSAAKPASRAAPGMIDISAGLPFASRFKLRSEEHTSELQSRLDLVCRLLLVTTHTRLHTYRSAES